MGENVEGTSFVRGDGASPKKPGTDTSYLIPGAGARIFLFPFCSLRSPLRKYNRPRTPSDNAVPMHPDSVAFLRKLVVLTTFSFGLFLAYELLHVLAILAFAAFFAALFSPALTAMNRWKVPDFLGILLIYFGIIVLAVTVFATTLPIFATQIVALFSALSSVADRLASDYASGGIPAL